MCVCMCFLNLNNNDLYDTIQSQPIKVYIYMSIFHDLQKQHPNRPLFVLAPMADVTDVAFRTVIQEAGGCDVLWTEFVSADGLVRATEIGKYKLKKDLLYTPAQHPIVAQLFSSTPEHMYQSVTLCLELGFDGVDINMGCPDKSIEKQKCGAAMIKHPELARAVIEAAKKAATVPGPHGPERKMAISVKTRVGYNAVELDTWIPILLDAEVDLITIHARTRKEMSKVPANWDHVKTVVKMRDEWAKIHADKIAPLIFGNGDVESVVGGIEKCTSSGADGAMIGRAMFGNPWFFRDLNSKTLGFGNGPTASEVTRKERIETLARQTEIFARELGDVKSFALMKKFFKTYMTGFEDAVEIRGKIMDMETAGEVVEFLRGRV
jgi:tRNA-dihydrouridine synthase